MIICISFYQIEDGLVIHTYHYNLPSLKHSRYVNLIGVAMDRFIHDFMITDISLFGLTTFIEK